jgi:hypothetical protein
VTRFERGLAQRRGTLGLVAFGTGTLDYSGHGRGRRQRFGLSSLCSALKEAMLIRTLNDLAAGKGEIRTPDP